MSSESGPVPTPSAKRRRIALACSACRTRKSRCDGARPTCSNCTSQRLVCAYEATDHLTNDVVRKELVNGLEQRVKSLETLVQRHDQLLNEIGSAQDNSAVSSSLRDEQRRIPSSASALPSHDIQCEATGLEDVNTEGVVDGTAISFLDEQDSGYFGSSSNISFMRHISRNMPISGIVAATGQNQGRWENDIIHSSRRPHLNSDTILCTPDTASAYILPPPTQLESLLESYFQKTGVLFPFIHPTSFLQTYHDIRSNGFTRLRRTWLGLLNMVLAMAVSTDGTGKLSALERAAQSNIYYSRAVALCNTQILRGSNLEIVQYLLLMSQYLQGTQNSVQTWNIHGLAVKAAFSLGLHSEHANSRFPPIEQEVRKRTWFGCILLDRSLCLTFGRPSSIPEHFIQVSPPIPWTNINNATANRHDKDDISTVFLTAAIDLSKILHSIIARLYNHNLGYGLTLEEAELNLRVFQLEQEMSEWQAFQDSRLRIWSAVGMPDIAASKDRVAIRCRNVLTLRHLHLEILLHRPFMIKALDKQVNPASQRPLPASVAHMANASIRKCVHSARTIISIVGAALCRSDAENDILGAWWFSLFYVFNAALTVFGGILIKSVDNEDQTGPSLHERISQARGSLEEATRALRALDRENRTVQKCEEYLKALLQALEQYSDRFNDDGAFEGVEATQWPLVVESMNSNMAIFDPTENQESAYDALGFFNGDLELGQFFISGTS
ncbi:hypothetical protein K461DRAFT_101621 [Myriangium duriaei CBS 260.36]|uniref:Zn(2)-C6 fungal-type domain-containing protein n=1 Tax=Myriangium duriaei CBS 260.36 TaxID=1168546 RepID=A0A9P4MM15_9PEZI|nr:hypothetical protein K461DRAFT_101621 [Myriangium duriaei CBS 260.36]